MRYSIIYLFHPHAAIQVTLLCLFAVRLIDSGLILVSGGRHKEAISLNCGRRAALPAALKRRLGGGLMNSDALIYQIFSTFNYHVKVLLIADLGATLLTAYHRRRCCSNPPAPSSLLRDFGLPPGFMADFNDLLMRF